MNPAPPAAVTADTLVPDLLRAHPEARGVLDRYGLSGCGGPHGPHEPLAFFARTHGVPEDRLLREIGEAIANPSLRPPSAKVSVADILYRRFFMAGILVVLTAGATWGAWLLWKIGQNGSFTSVSVLQINAHGHAQIFGWVGLFIMGFAYQALPRLWHTTLNRPRIGVLVFLLMLIGIVVRTAGMTAAGSWSLSAAMAGGIMEMTAIALFAFQMFSTCRKSGARMEPYIAFVFFALFWFNAQAVFSLWHTWNTMTAPTRDALLWAVATYQAPLRDIQIHGLALFMILGVSMRMLPAIYAVPRVPDRQAWTSLALLSAAVAGEVVLFIAYRWTENHVLAALLLIPWILLAVGVLNIAARWRFWRPLRTADGTRERSAKFVRIAYGWLVVSLAMLLFMPAYLAIAKVDFSHAFYGAIRHAITVGFISMMIMGFGAKVVPMLAGMDPRRLTSLWEPFLLVNTGCFLRVSSQIATDFQEPAFRIIGLSGALEVTGLAWWGVHLLGILIRSRRAGEAETTALQSPGRVLPSDKVGAILAQIPGGEAILLRHGFHALRNPAMRRHVAPRVNIGQACAMMGANLDAVLGELGEAVHGVPSIDTPRREG